MKPTTSPTDSLFPFLRRQSNRVDNRSLVSHAHFAVLCPGDDHVSRFQPAPCDQDIGHSPLPPHHRAVYYNSLSSYLPDKTKKKKNIRQGKGGTEKSVNGAYEEGRQGCDYDKDYVWLFAMYMTVTVTW